jgi:radical SAM superfamily enzyme YgiQ (UPF0313 family)
LCVYIFFREPKVTEEFLLINTNVVRPPVSPVGLEYTGEALVGAGFPVRVLDLAFEAEWKAALATELKNYEPMAVGLSVRNTDDCSFVSRKSFLPWVSEVVSEVRRLTQAFVLLGGVGFSVMPDITLKLTGADAGIAGDGEEALVALSRCLTDGEDFTPLPNLIHRVEGDVFCNPRVNVDYGRMPPHHRDLFDNKRYEELGAIVGVETKRGCARRCIFCADPVAKGSSTRLRPPRMVVQEFQNLLAQGVSWFHICDSEFNLPIQHSREICQALIEAGLGDKLRWYTYCSPVPFDRELARLMKHAGCAGINFGVDSLCNEQLSRLGRSHSVADIQRLAHILQEERMNYMFDLLVGGPGETQETLSATINQAKMLNVSLVGIAAGVRVYPGTPLGEAVANGSVKGGLYPEEGHKLHEPLFYLSPSLGDDTFEFIDELVAGDPRFLVLSAPTEEGSYNYADDEALCQWISGGARGAYWDIIGRHREK